RFPCREFFGTYPTDAAALSTIARALSMHVEFQIAAPAMAALPKFAPEMRSADGGAVIWEHCQWDGIKRAVKRRLRQRCPSDPEDELDWKAGRLWPTMASSIEPAEIEAETFLARQPDLDSIARR